MPLFVVTNQSGVARGMMTEQDVEAVNLRMLWLLGAEGVKIEGIYYCPHHPDATDLNYGVECQCRKPKPGLLERAAREHDVDLSGSFMIGDSLRDLQAGRAAGAKSLLVLTGNGRETLGGAPGQPAADAVVEDLVGASEWIARRRG
jgi:D-glycero-D-manno-heptose 1,7-bisphosphate phosphatase